MDLYPHQDIEDVPGNMLSNILYVEEKTQNKYPNYNSTEVKISRIPGTVTDDPVNIAYKVFNFIGENEVKIFKASEIHRDSQNSSKNTRTIFVDLGDPLVCKSFMNRIRNWKSRLSRKILYCPNELDYSRIKINEVVHPDVYKLLKKVVATAKRPYDNFLDLKTQGNSIVVYQHPSRLLGIAVNSEDDLLEVQKDFTYKEYLKFYFNSFT